jgi:hypothetical protein
VQSATSGLKYTSALKMETALFSETLASTEQSTQRFNPKEHNQNCHRRENFKYHIFFGMLHRAIRETFTRVSEVLAASIIALMMEAANIFETLLNFYSTVCSKSQRTPISMLAARKT